MKESLKLFFYSHISNLVSTYTEGEKWQKVAVKTVKFLNADLGDNYPDAFYYLKAKVKGGYKYYAGSVVDPGQWDDSRFKNILEPPDPSGEIEKESRRKGN